MTYTDLAARMAAALAIDTTTDDGWATYLPAIIEQAELRCYRDADFLAVRKVLPISLAAGAAQFAAPADWMLGQRISLVLSGSRPQLDRRDDTYLREYGTGTGTPRYWCEPTQGQILLAPVPDVVYAAELGYHVRPAPLSAANATTWLSINCADLLFYAAMVAATGYQKNFGAQADDPRAALSWDALYKTVLPGVLLEEARRKGDNSFDSSRAPPPTSNMPTPEAQG